MCVSVLLISERARNIIKNKSQCLFALREIPLEFIMDKEKNLVKIIPARGSCEVLISFLLSAFSSEGRLKND